MLDCAPGQNEAAYTFDGAPGQTEAANFVDSPNAQGILNIYKI